VLDRAGIDIESHAASHAILTALGTSAVAAELSRSREALRIHGLGRCGFLAYPSGLTTPQISMLASQVGYRAAFTTEYSLVDAKTDLHAIPRVGLHDDVSRTAAELRFALAMAASHSRAAPEGLSK
jgi:hypothetical protein